MPASPNTANYQYGAGACWLKVDGVDEDFRHIGNVPTLGYSSEITVEDHKQSMSGIKSVDFDFITEVSAKVDAVLEEVTPENMALYVLGAIADSGSDKVIGGLTVSKFEADFKFIPDNPFGANIEFHARVSITPNGDYNFITEGLNSIPITMKVLKSAGKFGRWVFVGVAGA